MGEQHEITAPKLSTWAVTVNTEEQRASIPTIVRHNLNYHPVPTRERQHYNHYYLALIMSPQNPREVGGIHFRVEKWRLRVIQKLI